MYFKIHVAYKISKVFALHPHSFMSFISQAVYQNLSRDIPNYIIIIIINQEAFKFSNFRSNKYFILCFWFSNLGKFINEISTRSSIFLIAFTYFFFKFSFMCNGGRNTFFKGAWLMFFLLTSGYLLFRLSLMRSHTSVIPFIKAATVVNVVYLKAK